MVDGSKDFKFVIADDDIDRVRLNRDMIRKIYPEMKIYEFINGFEACSFLEAKSLGAFDPEEWVVISDYHMPLKKGDKVIDLCSKIGIDKKCLMTSDKNLMVDCVKFIKHLDESKLEEWITQL